MAEREPTLTEFLLARIAEREALAREAIPDWLEGTPWYAPDVYDTGVQNIAIGEDPRRVLARCEADRRIVERCRWVEKHPDWANLDELATHWNDASDTLDDLAAVYADHPDCREEWRP